MKNMREYEKEFVGYSDVATIVFRVFGKGGISAYVVRFGSDGCYDARMVDAECEIPESAQLVFSVDGYSYFPEEHPSGWFDVYDDERKTLHMEFGRELKVYRIGHMGLIIQRI